MIMGSSSKFPRGNIFNERRKFACLPGMTSGNSSNLCLIVNELNVHNISMRMFTILIAIARRKIRHGFLLLNEIRMFTPIRNCRQTMETTSIGSRRVPTRLVTLRSMVIRPREFAKAKQTSGSTILIIRHQVVPRICLNKDARAIVMSVPFLIQGMRPLFLRVTSNLLNHISRTPMVNPNVTKCITRRRITRLNILRVTQALIRGTRTLLCRYNFPRRQNTIYVIRRSVRNNVNNLMIRLNGLVTRNYLLTLLLYHQEMRINSMIRHIFLHASNHCNNV